MRAERPFLFRVCMMATALPANAHEVREVLKTMQQNLQCPICLESLSDPYNTQCGHSYCRECICMAIKRSKAPKCPLCKEPITKRSLRENVRLCDIVAAVGVLEQAIINDTGITDTPPRSIPHNGDTTGTPGVLLHSILHPTPMKQGGSDQNRVSPPKDKENDVGEEQQSTSSRTLTTRSMSRTQKKRKLFMDPTSQSQTINLPTTSTTTFHQTTPTTTQSPSSSSSPPRKKPTNSRQTSLPRYRYSQCTHKVRRNDETVAREEGVNNETVARKERVNDETVARKEEVNNDVALLTALKEATLRQTSDSALTSDPVAIATNHKQSPIKKVNSCNSIDVNIYEENPAIIRNGFADEITDIIIEEVPKDITEDKWCLDKVEVKSMIEDAPAIIDNNDDVYLSPCIPQQNIHVKTKPDTYDSIVYSSQYYSQSERRAALPGLTDHTHTTPPTMTSPTTDHTHPTLTHGQNLINCLLATSPFNTSPHNMLPSSNESTPSISPRFLVRKNLLPKTPPLSQKAPPILQYILPENHPFLSVSSPPYPVPYTPHATILDFS